MEAENKRLFKVKKIMNNVFCISSSGVCMFLLVGEKHGLLFDTGYGFIDFQDVIRDITRLPIYAVNSHGHIDHTGGNHFFNNPVYIHKADLEVYRTHNSSHFRKLGLESVHRVQKLLFWMKLAPKYLNEEAYISAKPIENFHFIEEGKAFDLGGMTAEVVEIPGHTPGSIGMLVKEKNCF